MSIALHDGLTLAEIGRRLTAEHYTLLDHVRGKLVKSTRDAKNATIQALVGGLFTTVTEQVRALETAGLVRRGKKSWFLTAAGETLLNGYAGGAA